MNLFELGRLVDDLAAGARGPVAALLQRASTRAAPALALARWFVGRDTPIDPHAARAIAGARATLRDALQAAGCDAWPGRGPGAARPS